MVMQHEKAVTFVNVLARRVRVPRLKDNLHIADVYTPSSLAA